MLARFARRGRFAQRITMHSQMPKLARFMKHRAATAAAAAAAGGALAFFAGCLLPVAPFKLDFAVDPSEVFIFYKNAEVASAVLQYSYKGKKDIAQLAEALVLLGKQNKFKDFDQRNFAIGFIVGLLQSIDGEQATIFLDALMDSFDQYDRQLVEEAAWLSQCANGRAFLDARVQKLSEEQKKADNTENAEKQHEHDEILLGTPLNEKSDSSAERERVEKLARERPEFEITATRDINHKTVANRLKQIEGYYCATGNDTILLAFLTLLPNFSMDMLVKHERMESFYVGMVARNLLQMLATQHSALDRELRSKIERGKLPQDTQRILAELLAETDEARAQ